MRIVTSTLIMLSVAALVAVSGCVSEAEYNDLKAQNRIQQTEMTKLEDTLRANEVMLQQLQADLRNCRSSQGLTREAKDAEIAALEADIAKKKELIEQLKSQLMTMGGPLPMELNLALKEFAEGNDMVTFDEATGVLKFKSDLLFKSGSAEVGPEGASLIAKFAQIVSSGQAQEFDIVVAGHTDDQPIKYSKDRHPTNWHLAAHRAIAVAQVMLNSNVTPQRVSVRGFGEYRPAEPNKPGNGGNAANRRVEIYMVPKGA